MVTELSGGSDLNVSDPLLDRLRLATLGTYDVAGELGRGGMAIVYVAKDLKLGRTVAIKVMDPRLSLAHGMAERFLQEARIAANLQHPNIIVVHDVKQNEDLIFFVMSLIEGGAVDELCRDNKALPIEQVRWILLQATRALAHAHSEGIIHRDVKPANILINLKGDVILTDFGIAKAVGGNGMTQSGTQIGTPTYMSPEQFGDRPVGSASDQYALGVTAYQLLTGKPPFTGDLYQLIAAHGGKLPIPIRELRPDCPAFLANAVMRMLEKRAEDRWPVLDDLQGVFGASMAMDGGVARKQLAAAAQNMQRERTGAIPSLSAKTPVSPIPVGSSRLRAETAPPSESLVVSISPPGATIYVGGSLALKATVATESGEPVLQSAVVWTTSNPEILRVDGDGSLRGVSTGSAVVRAAVHGGFEEATIRVEAAPITRLTVTLPNLTLKVGDVAHPTVSAIDANGQSRAEISLSWVSRAPSVAVLESPGSIRAVTPGAATVEVSSGNVRRLIEVTVVRRPVASVRIRPTTRILELGDASALFADAQDDLGQAVRQPAPRWSSSAPDVIHVDSAGTALAIGPGVAVITVEIDDASDSVELEAIEAPVGAIDIRVTVHAVEVGDEVPLTLAVRDQVGAFRSASGVRVWSSAPGIAEVDTKAMVVRALAVGAVEIHAASDAAGASAAVKAEPVQLAVSTATVARIELFPTSVDFE
ncbi:MAG: protein kinase, partial [Gemmatimonadota bacterium]|nr:protein kinase [Gemmatimonadota bacterium]